MITVEFKRLNLTAGDRVLDIGCGTGRHSCGLYANYPVRIVAADRSKTDLDQARSRLAYHQALDDHVGGSWDTAAVDIADLPFEDGAFQAVICSEVLEHVSDVQRALKESIRVLQSGHILAVSVPRRWPEKICWTLSQTYANQPGGHVRIFSARRLTQLLTGAGLQFVGSHHAHSLHTPYWWLKCLVGPQRDDSKPVNAYHRFLVWEMMNKPPLIGQAERFLNPLFGKSLVVYYRKPALL